MRTIYLTFAIIALSFFATSCRSRQGSHQQVRGFTQQAPQPQAQPPQPTTVREVAPPRPVVQVSYRQEAGQTTVRQVPVPPVVAQTPPQPSMRDLLEAGHTPIPPPPPRPVPTPTVTRLAPDGQTNVGVTFIESPEPVRQTPTQQIFAQQAPVNPAFVQHTPVHQPVVRQESISPIFATDAANLRRYSVVVASLGNRGNAETLQRRLQNDGHHVILAQNERGMFRVIVGSFDNQFQAIAQKDELRRRYSAMGSPDFLIRMYGIPFNDLWILGRHF